MHKKAKRLSLPFSIRFQATRLGFESKPPNIKGVVLYIIYIIL